MLKHQDENIYTIVEKQQLDAILRRAEKAVASNDQREIANTVVHLLAYCIPRLPDQAEESRARDIANVLFPDVNNTETEPDLLSGMEERLERQAAQHIEDRSLFFDEED
jgi:hypothetical protein